MVFDHFLVTWTSRTIHDYNDPRHCCAWLSSIWRFFSAHLRVVCSCQHFHSLQPLANCWHILLHACCNEFPLWFRQWLHLVHCMNKVMVLAESLYCFCWSKLLKKSRKSKVLNQHKFPILPFRY